MPCGLACQDAKRQLCELAAGKLGMPDRAVKISELFTPLGYLLKGGELIGQGVYTASMSSEDQDTGQGKRVVFGYAYGAAAAVTVNVEMGGGEGSTPG